MGTRRILYPPRVIEPALGDAILADGIALIRGILPAENILAQQFYPGGGMLVQPEKKPNPYARTPEDHVSKVFLIHRTEHAGNFARDERILSVVEDLLGRDLDFVQSQLIFKNSGAWGQPWHQDAYYFPFDHRPQVGVWLAISEATLQNGCLSVLPGSHKQPIHEHLRESHPDSNYGYLEIRDADFSAATPVLMKPGDVLFFHSFLMHRSEDNRSRSRRAALVYHYTVGGTKQVGDRPNPVIDFFPVRRAAH